VLGVFAICKTDNAFCEAGLPTLTEVQELKKLKSPPYTRPPWLVDENETIDLTMCTIPKGASKERIKAQFTSLMADKYEEFDQIYTDGLLMNDKVGFAIVTNN
jgi:hypothetical protein